MDPHLLRTFVAVVDNRSFSAAAGVLGYTQSAVSQHIAALEADLGTQLVERRPVGPTGAGERLMEHARPLLLRLAAARADIVRLHAARSAQLTVAVSPLALTSAFTHALARIRRSSPGLEVSLRVLGRDAVVGAVMAGDAGLGLVDGAAAPTDPLPLPDPGPLTTAALAAPEQPLAVLLPAGHPLARRSALRLPDLTDAQWLDAPDAAIPLTQLRAAARTDGFCPQVTYRGTDIKGVGTLVAGGHGLAVLPLTAAAELPGTSAVPLSAPRLVHRTEALHPARPAAPVPELVALLAA
ncbi:LysR family transcriptional regulator [Streptomyces sp. NPDC055189]